MEPTTNCAATNCDCAALARLGAHVRRRLASAPGMRRLGDERAEIYACDRFLAPQDCAHLIHLIDAEATPSCLADDSDRSNTRTSSSSDIDQSDMVVRQLEERLCALTGLCQTHSEAVQGQRYETGQFFEDHCDWFDTSAPYWTRERRCGGQRSWTAMVYLNGVPQGGVTEFTRLALRVRPRAGGLLLWNNALPDGHPNPYTLHAARPVLDGAKYVITKWFRTHRWQ